MTAPGDALDGWEQTVTGRIAPSTSDPDTRPEGFVRGTWLLDRESGRGISVTLWRTREALDAADASAATNRDRLAQATGGTVEVFRAEVVADT